MNLSDIANKVLEDIKQEAIKDLDYIENPQSKEKFIKKINYRLNVLDKTVKENSLLTRLLEEVEREEQEEKEAKENGDGGQVPPPPIPKTTGTMSIRELAFWKDKETARTESLRRAKVKWNF